MGAKMPRKATLIGGYFLRLINRYKNNTPLECATTESYSIHERLLKNGTTIKRSYASVIVCTTYSVLRLHYLVNNSHNTFPPFGICQSRFLMIVAYVRIKCKAL